MNWKSFLVAALLFNNDIISLCYAQTESQIIAASVGGSMTVLLFIVAVYFLCRNLRNKQGSTKTQIITEGYENIAASNQTETEIPANNRPEIPQPTCRKETKCRDVATQTAEIQAEAGKKLHEALFENGIGKEMIPDDFGREEKHPPPLKRGKSREEITFISGWRRTVTLVDLMKANIILETRVQELEREEVTEEQVEKELEPFLIGKYPIAGIYIKKTGQKMALYHAYEKGIISRGTAVSLLEAQAAVGSIIDPEQGSKMSVDEALDQGLIDKKIASVLSRAERAVTGFKSRKTNEKLSLFQAMKQDLVVENHGIRLLEAQIATGGIIDPIANVRLPVEIAYERGLFDRHLHETLKDPSDDTKGFLDPNTKENLTYLELIQRCINDENHTDLLLLPVVTDDEIQEYTRRYSMASFTFSSNTISTDSESNDLEQILDKLEAQ